MVLAVLMPLAAARAGGAPGVLILSPSGTNAGAYTLASWSADGGKEIATFNNQVWYGADEDSAAFLQLKSQTETRLLVVDRKTLAVVADKTLEGFGAWPLHRNVAESLAVRSKDSVVYFNGFDPQRSFGFTEANWKTGEAHPIPSTPHPSVIYTDALIALPAGFAWVGPGRTVVLYDEASRRELPPAADPAGYDRNQARQVYYVPTLGLMEYYMGSHRQLTDASFRPAGPQAQTFPSTEMITRVFVRNTQGRPFLIWGENKDADAGRYPEKGVKEIVIVDAASGKVVLRKPLGGDFSRSIQPNPDGTKIYLFQPETGEIFCLDRDTETISPFARTQPDPKTAPRSVDGWNFAMVAAN